jgi:hypothetical protein
VDTWDFGPGDVWYFPANAAHTVLGLAPSGCTYMTGWNAGAFDERDSFGASSWMAATPTATLAQGLGISEAAAARLKASTPAASTFVSQGVAKEMEAVKPVPVRAQWPKLIHKFPLSQNTYSVSGAAAAAGAGRHWLMGRLLCTASWPWGGVQCTESFVMGNPVASRRNLDATTPELLSTQLLL